MTPLFYCACAIGVNLEEAIRLFRSKGRRAQKKKKTFSGAFVTLVTVDAWKFEFLIVVYHGHRVDGVNFYFF